MQSHNVNLLKYSRKVSNAKYKRRFAEPIDGAKSSNEGDWFLS